MIAAAGAGTSVEIGPEPAAGVGAAAAAGGGTVRDSPVAGADVWPQQPSRNAATENHRTKNGRFRGLKIKNGVRTRRLVAPGKIAGATAYQSLRIGGKDRIYGGPKRRTGGPRLVKLVGVDDLYHTPVAEGVEVAVRGVGVL